MRVEENITFEEVQKVSETVIGRLNELTGRSFKPHSKGTVNLLKAALKKGYSETHLLSIVEHKVFQWINVNTMNIYLRPRTLFSISNLYNYNIAAKAFVSQS